MTEKKPHIPKDYPVDRKLPGYPDEALVLIDAKSFVTTKYPVGDRYTPQPNNWTCGPTSLFNALMALGERELTLADVIKTSKTNPQTGTDNSTLAQAANKLAPHRQVISGAGADFKGLKSMILEGYAVIINFREPNSGFGHFALLEGISDTSLHFADPSAGPACLLSRDSFDFRSYFNEPPIEGWFLAIR